jgi:hypothetical protein
MMSRMRGRARRRARAKRRARRRGRRRGGRGRGRRGGGLLSSRGSLKRTPFLNSPRTQLSKLLKHAVRGKTS